MSRGRLVRLAILLVLAGIAYLGGDRVLGPGPVPEVGSRPPIERPTADPGEAAILGAYQQRISDLIVEAGGTVEKVLADDNSGSRHQRFIVRLASGHTVLVSHNIDLAPRAQGLREGDRVRFRGEYEWNERGGVVHWTHHDPRGRHPGGWIEHRDQRYE